MSMGDRNAQPAGQVYIRTFAAGSTFRSPMLMAATPPLEASQKSGNECSGRWRLDMFFIFIYIFFKLGNDICHLPAGGSAPVGASGESAKSHLQAPAATNDCVIFS